MFEIEWPGLSIKGMLKYDEEDSEPKWVNPVLNIIGVSSLRLGGLHITEHKI